nr:reverse transcriptase [Tanacetum cinerariifolium]
MPWYEKKPKEDVVENSSGNARVKDPQGKEKDDAGIEEALEEDMNKKTQFGVSKCRVYNNNNRTQSRMSEDGGEQGIDFEETFSPVARFETVRIILALAAPMRWTVFQYDVKSAFLDGELKEEVYVQQREFFEVPGDEHKLYKLEKALYGLKEAPQIQACEVRVL